MESADYVLQARDLVKRYRGVTALDRVSVSIRRGTIHGLLGENGAGKSTLVKLIAGLVSPTSGQIVFDGRDVQGLDVKAMEQRGVFLVPQEPMIVNQLTVADNLLLGRWPNRGGWIDQRQMRHSATESLRDTGLLPDELAETLTAVERRKLNILRALFSGGKLIILDEPTTALTLADRQQLFDFMRRLRAQGITFLFISHYNEEILSTCDGVSVLRDGRLAGEAQSMEGFDSDKLSELVLGKGLHLFMRDKPPQHEPPVWRARDVMAEHVAVKDFEVFPGEILGFAGLPGSGAKEFGKALFGLNPVRQGTLERSGETIGFPQTPREGFDQGIAYLSDDRHHDGLVAIQTIGENISLSSLSTVSTAGFIKVGAERRLINEYFERLAVKAGGPEVAVATLSGGNQQKVCLGRVLATKPRLLILDEPTRGIDVGVREEVHKIIDGLTQTGVSVVVITSDLEEMVRIVDRVCLFVDHKIVASLSGDKITKEKMLAIAFTAAERHQAETASTH